MEKELNWVEGGHRKYHNLKTYRQYADDWPSDQYAVAAVAVKTKEKTTKYALAGSLHHIDSEFQQLSRDLNGIDCMVLVSWACLDHLQAEKAADSINCWLNTCRKTAPCSVKTPEFLQL